MMVHHIFWKIQSAVNKAFPNLVLTLPWATFCDDFIKLKPIVNCFPVCWQFPTNGTLKINTDGSFSASTGRARMGRILREDWGEFIMAFSSSLESNSSIEAEALEARKGLELCYKKI
ncbi:hypothetical protein FXO38_23073 [Capsicum annuum]|nr:hypothetical protein FXO38_23073 [Capsicum annuum]